MSKYVMFCSETDGVCNQIAAQYNALDDLTGELDKAIALTYVAKGFGVSGIRQNILMQKSELEDQMANLVLIQKTLSEIKNCTETYENNARNLVWKTILIDGITNFFDVNGNTIITWSDVVDTLENILGITDSAGDILDLFQILGEFEIEGLDKIMGPLGDFTKFLSILLDFSEGDFAGGIETATKWIMKELLGSVSCFSGVAGSFGASFLVGWAWNAGEALIGGISDAINGEGVFADGVDASDILIVASDVVIDSAGETIYDVSHGILQGVTVVASWFTGGETYDEIFPEAATYEGFKKQTVELGSTIASEWLS